MNKPDILTLLKTGHFHVALTMAKMPMLQPRDNFRIVPRNYFRFCKNRVRFSLAGHRGEDLDGEGSYHVE